MSRNKKGIYDPKETFVLDADNKIYPYQFEHLLAHYNIVTRPVVDEAKQDELAKEYKRQQDEKNKRS